MCTDHLLRLRRREYLKLWDKENKLYIQIQLNKNEKFICWERWVKKVNGNWVNWNKYLSLKDVNNILNQIKIKNDTSSNPQKTAKSIR